MKKRMQQSLENLRARSDAEKQTFAFMSALCMTAIIAIIWVADFSGDIRARAANQDQTIASGEIETASPFEIISAQFENFTLEGFTD